MESLFGQSQRRRRAGGSGFESLKRLGHISPAVQSHLKHASPSSPSPIPALFSRLALADPVPDCRCTSPYAPRWPSLHSARTSTSSSTSEAPSRPWDAWPPSPSSSPCPLHGTRRGTAWRCSCLPRSFKARPLVRSSTLLLTWIRGQSSSLIHYITQE
jgi:hypothetical protein